MHNSRLWSRRQALWCAAILVTTLGCGRSSDLPLAPVSGSVSFKGQTLQHGRVIFTPEPGTVGPQSIGEIDSDGNFSMRTAEFKGAPLGKHRVTVHCRKPSTEQERLNLVITKLLIPERYARHDKSPLEFEVIKGKQNEYEIVLE